MFDISHYRYFSTRDIVIDQRTKRATCIYIYVRVDAAFGLHAERVRASREAR